MEIRHTEMADLPRLREIYAYAREFMKRTGNPNQWMDHRPPESRIIRDIEDGVSYAVIRDGIIHGVFAFIVGEDPTYLNIEDGAWLNDEPYGTIHRIASDGEVRGLMHAALEFCSGIMAEEGLRANIRIDTHEENAVMRSVLKKEGFAYCGVIYVDNGTARMAFQRAEGSF